MNEENVKKEIAEVIRSNKCQFRRGSNLITVTAVQDVSITIWKINEDNPALDNYEFEGSANLSILSVEESVLTQRERIKGYAKVKAKAGKSIDVQINDSVSVY